MPGVVSARAVVLRIAPALPTAFPTAVSTTCGTSAPPPPLKRISRGVPQASMVRGLQQPPAAPCDKPAPALWGGAVLLHLLFPSSGAPHVACLCVPCTVLALSMCCIVFHQLCLVCNACVCVISCAQEANQRPGEQEVRLLEDRQEQLLKQLEESEATRLQMEKLLMVCRVPIHKREGLGDAMAVNRVAVKDQGVP